MSSAEREQYNRFCFFVKAGCTQSPEQKRLYVQYPYLYKTDSHKLRDKFRLLDINVGKYIIIEQGTFCITVNREGVIPIPTINCYFPWMYEQEIFDEAKILRHDEIADYPIIIRQHELKGYTICSLSPINKEWHKRKGFKTTPQRCLWCGAVLSENEKGRTKVYCDESCKRKDMQFRKKYLEMIQKANPEDVYEFLKLQRIPFSLIPEDKKERAFYILTELYLQEIIDHRSIMATLRGNCKRCGKPIPIDKPMNAQYCCDECSSRGRKLKYYHSKKEES